jgi:hypothetical protein
MNGRRLQAGKIAVRIYCGKLESGAYHVRVADDAALAVGPGLAYEIGSELPSHDELFKAPPPPFRWGDDGPGTAHLAAALLAELVGQDTRTVRAALPYLRRFLARLPADGFEISEDVFRAFRYALNGQAQPAAVATQPQQQQQQPA